MGTELSAGRGASVDTFEIGRSVDPSGRADCRLLREHPGPPAVTEANTITSGAQNRFMAER